MIEVLWTPDTKNPKTGDVPTGWIGATRSQCMDSCKAVACPLLPKAEGGDGQCYAWHGLPNRAFSSMVKARARGKVYDLAHALASRRASARMVRLGALGDPSACSPLAAAFIASRVRAAGLVLVGYTHGWRTADHWRGRLMASCDTLAEADQAGALGWRSCVVLPRDHEGRRFTTPAGQTGVVCPAQIKPGVVTCNTCRLCDGSARGPVIGFIDHGPASRRGRQ